MTQVKQDTKEIKKSQETKSVSNVNNGNTKDTKKVVPVDTNKGAAKAVAKTVFGARKKMFKRGRPERRDEFDQRILDIARVTRVMAGGKRMRFRVCIAIGDKKGKAGVALGKGADVAIAVNKAVNRAKKDMVTVPIVNGTIPHEVFHKYGAAKILFRPAKKGKGVIAGGIVRVILELAGIQNVTSKILGTNNKVTNAKCTIEALRQLKQVEKKIYKKNDNKSKAVKPVKVEKK